MSKVRNQFTTEFKQECVNLVVNQGYGIAQAASAMQVYFCDPQSPWQRGSNENTNRLLRQYYPKKTPLNIYAQSDLDEVASALNARPRKTLGYKTPVEVLYETVALTP